MRGVQAARERFPDKAAQISLSLHCETAEIMTAYTKIVESEKKLEGLAAYHARARRIPKASRYSSPPTSPTRRRCRRSICFIFRPGKRCRPRSRWRRCFPISTSGAK
jgi:hypothetical protein